MPGGGESVRAAAAAFKRNGIAAVRGFASAGECEAMKARMRQLIAEWNPRESAGSVFHTTQGKHVNNDYFLGSSEGVRFFFEPAAVDEATGQLRGDMPKELSVNKVGHALHWQDPVFREFSTSKKVSEIVEKLGWVDPVLPQSMYIFKQPHVGGPVSSHQDSTFLFTTPRQTCLGLWLALDDATEQNGCLWARPGSHVEPVRKHFHRNPAFARGGDVPPLVFREMPGAKAVPWELGFPESPSGGARDALVAAGFEPLPVSAGDLVLIHGEVDHLSLPNTSPLPRHSFQLHLIEGPNQGVEWHPANWLQYGGGRRFPALRGGAAPRL